MDSISTRDGKEPVTIRARRQVFRKAGTTTVYDISPLSGIFLRRIYDDHSFITETYFSKEKARRAASYSIDISKDYFGLGEPFEFTVQMKGEDGKVASEMTTSVSFDGTVEVDLGGCTYRLTKIVEQNNGTVNDKPFSNRTVAWYSRELKTSLYSRAENGGGFVLEFRARDISTNVTPVE
jgi:hypothetical protein